MNDHQIVNPYNFVPFSRQAPFRTSPEQIYQHPASLLHGYLDVQLTNSTPLIIPESKPYQTDQATEHKYYHFFRMPDEERTPAIPGSEIRGLVRSIYETVTNSCTTVVLDHNDYSMRTSPQGSFKETGLLEYDPAAKVWYLHTAWTSRIPLGENSYNQDLKFNRMRYRGIYRNGQKVFFTGSAASVQLVKEGTPQARAGWILFNEPAVAPRGEKKYSIRILEKGSQLLKTWYHDEPFKMLDDILNEKVTQSSQNRSRSMPAHSDYREALQKVKTNGGFLPVWYLGVNRGSEMIYYLSIASIGRVHLNRTWEEIMGSHSPCREYNALCPACRLFGTANDAGLKGRLQFTDALLTDTAEKQDFVSRTLDILGSPRPSAYEFYIRRPQGDRVQYWNYDYYGVSTSQEGLKYVDMAEASPRGRKFYWHGQVKTANAEKGKLNATMESLKEGHHFSFRVYFNGITERQLNELKYSLTLGENRADSPLQFKIGHARPLGYGSVKLVIEKEVLRKVSLEGDQIHSCLIAKNVPAAINAPEQTDALALAALKAICDKRKTEKEAVGYPTWQGKREKAVFEWFTNNRMVKGGNWKTLPEPTDPVIAVPSADGTPLTNASWNTPSGSRNTGRTFAPQSSSGYGSSPRPGYGSSPKPGYNSSPRPAPASSTAQPGRGTILPNTVFSHAKIDRVVGTAFVYVTFNQEDDPNRPGNLQGKLRYQASSKSRYRPGNEVRIKIIRYNPEGTNYDVSLW